MPDGFRKADDLLDSLAFHVQSHKKCGDLSIAALAAKNLGHDAACFVTREGLAMIGDTVKRVSDHGRYKRST
jgi:hypothetical protein